MRIQIDHGIRDIFGKLQKLDDVAAGITNDCVSYFRNERAAGSPSPKDFHYLWSKSYLDIVKVIIALLEYPKIELIETLDDDGQRSIHMDPLRTITKAGSPFGVLFLSRFSILGRRDQDVFGVYESGGTLSVHDLLDALRKFRDWHCFGKSKGAALPTMNNKRIAFPGALSIRSWFYLIIRILFEALQCCLEAGMSYEDRTRKPALG